MEQTGPAEARRLYEIARDKYHKQRAAIPETNADENGTAPEQQPEAGNNDTVPLLQPEIPTVRVDDESSYDQQMEEPEKDDSDSPPQQKQEEPGKEPDDESPSAPLLQREIDVEIKPDDQKSSSAPGEENTSA